MNNRDDDGYPNSSTRPGDPTLSSVDATRSSAAVRRTPGLPEGIGSYRILRLIAQGGMGAVYEAEQEKPHRIVALKVIKPGYADEEMTRRFEQESQALGRLQHPGIAQIYEAGSAETAFGTQPFFAMELVEGESLLTYAREHKLKTRQCLELMARICDAVHHAHQRGLIHRDLKPGNILVDASGQPKILDFGIARITDSDQQATRQTDIGQLVGTLPYMSPEQVMADPFEIDIRTDVYSLGVILYELLAGRLPYSIDRKTLPEAVQVIREQEATRLSSLSRGYRGDIETIVSKALEKEKGRRYASAFGMAADIRRYLNDEPITARPASTLYQVRKFARRNRGLVAAVAVVFVVLVAGIIASSLESVRAKRAEIGARKAELQARSERDRAVTAEAATRQERDRAVNAESAANQARDRAVKAEAQARRERDTAVAEKRRADTAAATATAINDFLQTDLLAQASASGQQRGAKPDPDIKVRTVLDRAASHVAGRFPGKPQVEGSIESTIGTTYRHLGLYPEALQHQTRALELEKTVGHNNPATLAVATSLGDTYLHAGKYAEAESLLRETAAASARARGADDPATLKANRELVDVYVAEAKFVEAEPMLVDLLERERRVLGSDDETTLDTMNILARVYFVRRRLPDAERVLQEILAIRKRVFGPEHPDTMSTMNNLAVLYQQENRYAEAESLNEKVIDIRRRTQGPEHPETLNSVNNLGVLYAVEGKYSLAEPLYQKVLEQWRKQMGPEHPRTLAVMSNIAILKLGAREYASAESMCKNVLDIRTRVLGPEHNETLESMRILESIYETEGKYSEAEPLARKVSELRTRVLGPKHPDTMDALSDLGEVLLDERRYPEAESVLRQALETEKQARPEGFRRYWMENLLGASMAGEKKYSDAEPLLVSGYEGMKQTAAKVPDVRRQKLTKAGEQVLRLYSEWSKPDKLAQWKEIVAH
ncbi:MAG: tetratricopeptide repeat protein [Terriglobales bacterium]